MESLPDHLIIEILNRLNDSTELARCKLVSRTLNRLARQVRSIHLYCSLERYTKMRSPEAGLKVTLFKTIFNKLISDAEVPIESVSLSIDESVDRSSHYDYEYEEECDELFLTAGPFSDGWMTKIGHGLKSISIEALPDEFFPNPKQTNIMEVLSYHCQSLVELKLENAYLSPDAMLPMPLLTKLMLKNVVISDMCLNKLLERLPCLQVLNLIDQYGEVIDPKIHHLNLKELKWNPTEWEEHIALSSVTISAPNLIKLELECQDPITVSLHASSLSYFDLALERADELDVEKFKALKTLRLVSSELYYIFITFPRSTTVQNLTFDSPKCEPLNERIKFSLLDVFNVYPNVTSLTLGSEVWSQQMDFPLRHLNRGSRVTSRMKGLKQVTVYLELSDIDKTLSFILYVVGLCTKLSDMVLFIRRDVDLSVSISFVSLCMSQCSKVRWRWGTWENGTKDLCISNSVVGVANTV